MDMPARPARRFTCQLAAASKPYLARMIANADVATRAAPVLDLWMRAIEDHYGTDDKPIPKPIVLCSR